MIRAASGKCVCLVFKLKNTRMFPPEAPLAMIHTGSAIAVSVWDQGRRRLNPLDAQLSGHID